MQLTNTINLELPFNDTITNWRSLLLRLYNYMIISFVKSLYLETSMCFYPMFNI